MLEALEEARLRQREGERKMGGKNAQVGMEGLVEAEGGKERKMFEAWRE